MRDDNSFHDILGAFCPNCGYKARVKVDVAVSPKRDDGPAPKLYFDPYGITPICPNCGSRYGEGTVMAVLDPDITDLICALNMLGHKTDFSCQGHVKETDGEIKLTDMPYISFDPNAPDNDKLRRKRAFAYKSLKSKYPDIAVLDGCDWVGWSGDAKNLEAPAIFLKFLEEFVKTLENNYTV